MGQRSGLLGPDESDPPTRCRSARLLLATPWLGIICAPPTFTWSCATIPWVGARHFSLNNVYIVGSSISLLGRLSAISGPKSVVRIPAQDGCFVSLSDPFLQLWEYFGITLGMTLGS